MTTKSTRLVPAEERTTTAKPPKFWQGAVTLAVTAALVIGIGVGSSVLRSHGSATSAGGLTRGLPRTPDYHSLLVSPTDPRRLVLGTHYGLFDSTDGGASWRRTAFGRRDAMNLARASGPVTWAAGHNVLAKSRDGGKTWQDVSPPGLLYLDVHGFGVDPRTPNRLYAAIAGNGLYRSTNGGRSFELVTKDVGGDVFALAVTRDGRILAGRRTRDPEWHRQDGGRRRGVRRVIRSLSRQRATRRDPDAGVLPPR